MNPDQLRQLANGLADTLGSIADGTLDASPAEGAYIAGAHHAIQLALDETS